MGVDGGTHAFISGNSISENRYGICSYAFGFITIIGNNITNTKEAVFEMYTPVCSIIYHNNFVNNTELGELAFGYYSVFDDGYPSGGNYWSDYDGTDVYNGPYQNETGSDMIGDSPYAPNGTGILDNYPLMTPWVTNGPIPGDVNRDGKVSLADLVLLANAYGTTPASGGTPPAQHAWNPNADINSNGVVDLVDLVVMANHYGQHYP